MQNIISYVQSFMPLLITPAALIALYGIRVQVRDKQLEKSFDFSKNFFQNNTIRDAIKTTSKLINTLDSAELEKLAFTKSILTDDAISIIIILNEFERMARAIEYNIFNESFLYDSHATTLLKIYTQLQPFINVRRKENSRAYVSLSKLAIKWHVKHSKLM